MSKLLLIDGNAILHRAYHALPILTNKKGEPINAVYGFVSMLLNLINTFKPEFLVVAFDEKEKTFRKKKFEGYQAKRPPMDPFLVSQIGKTRDFLTAANIKFYSKSGFEADDVIGTLVKRATENSKYEIRNTKQISNSKYQISKKTKVKTVDSSQLTVNEIVIVTGDRDLFQLISDKVKVYVPVKGLKEGKLYGHDEVHAEFDFDPIQMIDYKALVGDSSDNYPGVSGIGPKTARELIVKYKTVEEIYKNIKSIPEKVGTKLTKGKEDAFFFKKLATVKNDVKIDFDLSSCDNWQIDSNDVFILFQEFGFNTLTERIFGKKNNSITIKKNSNTPDTKMKNQQNSLF